MFAQCNVQILSGVVSASSTAALGSVSAETIKIGAVSTQVPFKSQLFELFLKKDTGYKYVFKEKLCSDKTLNNLLRKSLTKRKYQDLVGSLRLSKYFICFEIRKEEPCRSLEFWRGLMYLYLKKYLYEIPFRLHVSCPMATIKYLFITQNFNITCKNVGLFLRGKICCCSKYLQEINTATSYR